MLPQPPRADRLKDLAFSAELSSDDELDFTATFEQHFITSAGERLPVSHPLLKAFLVVLASTYPRITRYEEAASRALGLARKYGYQGEADEGFLEALLDFSQMQGVRLHAFAPPHVCEETDFPQASRLTRLQACLPSWPVTNVFHLALDIDEWGRKLLSKLDGSVSTDVLGGYLLKELGDAGIETTPLEAAGHVRRYLDSFGRQGLLG